MIIVHQIELFSYNLCFERISVLCVELSYSINVLKSNICALYRNSIICIRYVFSV